MPGLFPGYPRMRSTSQCIGEWTVITGPFKVGFSLAVRVLLLPKYRLYWRYNLKQEKHSPIRYS